ncbi:TolC family protein [Massilia sp. P8910]|uniref:TolC family protein n=1 Tax=Massilia antarctica TaxID=2765360 RepID=UPI001E6265E4|nr:TolC family protein [Massilia antarctica]MCE3602835.1 TolC family protein [Massilia antarctica]
MPSPFFACKHAPHHRFWPPFRTVNAALATALFAIGIEAAGAPQVLTLVQAQQLAVARSRQLTAQDFAISGSRELAIAAGRLPDPVLKAGIDNLPVSGSDRLSLGGDFMTMRRIGFSQELTRSDKRRFRAARFEADALKSEAQRDVDLAAIERATATAWLERYYTEQIAALITIQLSQARQEIDAAEAAYRGGRGTRADIIAARSALLLLADRASDMNTRLRVSQSSLVRWTGTDGEVVLEGPPDIDHIAVDPATLDKDLLHYPQIAVLNRQGTVAEAEANLERAKQRPDWSIEISLQQRGAAYSNMVSVGVSVPIQWDRKNRQDHELSAKLAMVEQIKAERDEVFRDRLAATRNLILEWESGRERAARYVHDVLPLAQERTAASLASYRGGKATLTDVLAARRNETEMRLQALQLLLETARLWVQLNFLIPTRAAVQHPTLTSHKASK